MEAGLVGGGGEGEQVAVGDVVGDEVELDVEVAAVVEGEDSPPERLARAAGGVGAGGVDGHEEGCAEVEAVDEDGGAGCGGSGVGIEDGGRLAVAGLVNWSLSHCLRARR